MIENKLTH